MDDLKQAFDLMDENEDGKISEENFIFLVRNMGIPIPQNVKSSYTYDDFAFYVKQHTIITKEKFIDACKRLSTYSNNTIHGSELVSVMLGSIDKENIMYLLNNAMNANGNMPINNLL